MKLLHGILLAASAAMVWTWLADYRLHAPWPIADAGSVAIGLAVSAVRALRRD